jgi:hypothetical protein
MKAHMEQRHLDDPLPHYLAKMVKLQCDKCLYKSDQPGNLLRHMKRIHLKIREFECKGCSRDLSDKKRLMQHEKSNTDPNSDIMHCTKYKIVYPDVLDQLCHIEKDNSFACLKCGFEALKKDETIDHITTNHPPEGKIICTKCCQYTASKWKVMKHWSQCDGIGEQVTEIQEKVLISDSKCIICSYEPDTRDSLLKHIASIHGNEKELKCNGCSEQFSQNVVLVKHLKQNGCQTSVTSDQLFCSKFICITTKNFDVSKFLTYKDLLFSCTGCPFVTHSKNLAKMHVKLKHSSLPRKNQYLCKMCSIPPLKTKSQILAHLSDFHEVKTEFKDKTAAVKVLKSYCKECPYKSDTPNNVLRHVSRVHLKERNFMCEECGKSYTEKKGLNMHITLKHGCEDNISPNS